MRTVTAGPVRRNEGPQEFAGGRYRVLRRTDGRFCVLDYRRGKYAVEIVNGADDHGRMRDGFETMGRAIERARNLERLTPKSEWGEA